MRSDRDDAIDAAISAAAQALTSAPPSPAIRAGVRNRIGDDRVASAFRRKIRWWLIPAVAAAAVVLVAAIVGRILPGPAVPDGPGRVRPTDVRPPLTSTPPPSLVTTQPEPATAIPSAVSLPVRRLADAFEPPPEELEPLIPPITIPPLETELIVVDAGSGVMPIEIEPLRIEPLQGE